MTKTLSALVVVAALAAAVVTLTAVDQTREQKLQQAIDFIESKGDLVSAVPLLQDVARSADRALAARALLYLAQAQERQGQAEARKTYERIVKEFSTQDDIATEARARLAALGGTSTGTPTMTTRRVWSPAPDSASEIFRTDGRYLPYRGRSGILAVRDLATREDRPFTNQGPFDPSFGTAVENAAISRDGRQVAYALWNGNGPYDLRVVAVNAATSNAPPRILLSYKDLSSKDLEEAYPMDWSPDGKQILGFLQKKDLTYQLALISVADGSVRVLKSLGWRRPNGFFSPDGRYIAYDIQLKHDSADRDIFVLATDGSREATLVGYPSVDRVLGWAPDGKRVLFASNRTGSTGAWFIGAAEGRPQGAPELIKADIGNIVPIGSTRSGAFYYTVSTGVARDVYIASLDEAKGKVTAPGAPLDPRRLGGKAYAAWSPSGEDLAYISGGLLIRSMKTDEVRQLGLSPSLSFVGQTRWGRLHWAPDGRSLLATAVDEAQRQGIYQIDVKTGTVESIVRQEQGKGTPSYGVWSADGKAIFYALNRSLAFGVTRSQLEADEAYRFDRVVEDKIGVRVRNLETGQDTAVYRPALPSQINHLALSPDGRWLAFVSDRTVETVGKPAAVQEDLVVMPATGGETRELLRIHEGVTTTNALAVLEWTRTGEHLLYSSDGQLWRISAKGGLPERLGLASTTAREASLSMHPDGQRIAYTTGVPGRTEVWVMENFWPTANAGR